MKTRVIQDDPDAGRPVGADAARGEAARSSPDEAEPTTPMESPDPDTDGSDR
jgi:hypothetical protein